MRRVGQLDGLRALAVIAVIAEHFKFSWGIGGMYGVDVFFVLSGFLITGVLVGERESRGRVSLWRFYERRLLRLYPALIVMIVVLSPWATRLVVDHTWGAWAVAAGSTLTYTSDFFQLFSSDHFILGGLGQSWSLAIEEQFYLLWAPALVGLLALYAHPRRLAAPVLALAAVLLSLFVVLWSPEQGWGVYQLYFNPLTRFGELLLGAALALALSRTRGPLPRRLDVLVGVAALVGVVGLWWARRSYPSIYGRVGNPLEVFPIVAVCSALVIARLATSDRALLSRVLRIPPLPYVGRLSYSLYLWHFPIIVLLPDRAILALALTIVVSMASYHLVEMPFLRLKDRLRDTPVAGLTADGRIDAGDVPVPGELVAAPTMAAADASAVSPTAQA